MSEQFTFQAETQKLLDLVVHSLYSNKEIFLRELISNASDAHDRLRFECQQNPDLQVGDTEAEVTLTGSDTDGQRTLVIADNGIGMTRDEVIANLGTIARSGTNELWQKLKDKPGDFSGELIGQFGVGFYSAFMVADHVTVTTRRVGETQGWRWESQGKGEYTLTEATRDGHGTTIELTLKPVDDDAGIDDYTNDDVLKRIVKKHSDFVRYPVRIAGDTVNSMKAVWLKRKSEVKAEELNEFYKHVSHDFEDPLKTISVHAEGMLEYHALLFIPKRAPMDLFYPNIRAGLHLYAKNVKILDNCEDLLPRYLRFVKGVVDSADLSLNVSRELLQQDAQMRALRKGLTKKVVDAIVSMKNAEDSDYADSFWPQYGHCIKEGIGAPDSGADSDKLKQLLLFQSSADDSKLTSLADYVARMKDGQDTIYYLTGTSRTLVENSPHLEKLKASGAEVLYLVDPIDEVLVQQLSEFDGKKLQSAAKGEIANDDTDGEVDPKASEEYSGVLLRMQKELDDYVKEVRLSSRLTDSPACLVGSESDLTPQLEHMLRQANMDMPKQKRILELNPSHDISRKLKDEYHKDSSSETIGDYTQLLFGLASVANGQLPPEPIRFSKLVSKVMTN